MTMQRNRSMPGAIALVGSGEYLDAMNEVDTYLLETLGGARGAHLALLPTASGLEQNGPTYWNDLGLQHFQKLGVQDIRPTRILDRSDAIDPAQLALLRGADFFYFSGGNPQHVIETMRGTPAWDIITSAHREGAVLAGCSAGAMLLGGRTISIRQAMTSGQMDFEEALGIVPNIIVFPHFDRLVNFLDEKRFQQVLSLIPDGYTIAGIDEETALVQIEAQSAIEPATRWRVMGRQSVKLYTSATQSNQPRTLHNSEEVIL
jgi:cyanophycinase